MLDASAGSPRATSPSLTIRSCCVCSEDSGCAQILVGLEAPDAAGLDGLELGHNWKLRRRDGYLRAIERIQDAGITVNGCFVLGLDGHTKQVFDDVYDFVERTGLYEVQITVMTAFPGTPV